MPQAHACLCCRRGVVGRPTRAAAPSPPLQQPPRHWTCRRLCLWLRGPRQRCPVVATCSGHRPLRTPPAASAPTRSRRRRCRCLLAVDSCRVRLRRWRRQRPVRVLVSPSTSQTQHHPPLLLVVLVALVMPALAPHQQGGAWASAEARGGPWSTNQAPAPAALAAGAAGTAPGETAAVPPLHSSRGGGQRALWGWKGGRSREAAAAAVVARQWRRLGPPPTTIGQWARATGRLLALGRSTMLVWPTRPSWLVVAVAVVSCRSKGHRRAVLPPPRPASLQLRPGAVAPCESRRGGEDGRPVPARLGRAHRPAPLLRGDVSLSPIDAVGRRLRRRWLQGRKTAWLGCRLRPQGPVLPVVARRRLRPCPRASTRLGGREASACRHGRPCDGVARAAARGKGASTPPRLRQRTAVFRRALPSSHRAIRSGASRQHWARWAAGIGRSRWMR